MRVFCSASKKVTFSRWFRSFTISNTSSTICGAMPMLGLSRSTLCGLAFNARPTARTCCSPPEIGRLQRAPRLQPREAGVDVLQRRPHRCLAVFAGVSAGHQVVLQASGTQASTFSCAVSLSKRCPAALTLCCRRDDRPPIHTERPFPNSNPMAMPGANSLVALPGPRRARTRGGRPGVVADLGMVMVEPGECVCRIGRPVAHWFGVVDGLLKMSNDSTSTA